MKLELQDEKGLTGVFIEVSLEQIKEGLGLLSSSPENEAQLKESLGKVEELGTQVAELEEKLATAEAKTLSDFAPIEKANFVIAWAKDLGPEDQAIFCEGVGIPIATAAQVEEKRKAGKEVEAPSIIQGKTDRPGYKFLEHLNMSVKE